MLKDNKGITLVVLVVTIILMLILAGTTISTSNLLLRDTKQKTVVANMYVIKSEVESIYDEYQFNEDNSVLVGEEAYDLSDYGITITSGVDLWYIWNKDVLSSLGLDPSMLKGDTTFIVNYATSEVAYSAGCIDEDGNIEYTLTDIVD